MASFAYSAINAQGLELDGTLSAPDAPTAREQLRVKGLLPHRLEEVAGSGEEE
jgi:type II secretory pathway component PulF